MSTDGWAIRTDSDGVQWFSEDNEHWYRWEQTEDGAKKVFDEPAW